MDSKVSSSRCFFYYFYSRGYFHGFAVDQPFWGESEWPFLLVCSFFRRGGPSLRSFYRECIIGKVLDEIGFQKSKSTNGLQLEESGSNKQRRKDGQA